MDKTERPPIYKKWAQFDQLCTCGTRMAVVQREFEILVNQYLAKGMPLKNARLKTLKKLGIKKLCCLKEMTYFQKNFIYDNGIGAYTNITVSTGKKVQENLRAGNNGSNVGYEFLPMTNNEMPFDMNEYSRMLAIKQLSAFDKIEFLRRDGTNSISYIPQFPNYVVTESKNMPTVLSEVNPLTNAELSLEFLNQK
jgi:DNA-directed RNA polymerase subunit N (RpoN/RPB10)